MTIVPSRYQQDVYQAVQSGTPAIVVSAVAGSGKTTTLTSLLEYISPEKKVLYLTFGKDANNHLSAKVAGKMQELAGQKALPQADVRTVHSLGNGALASARIKGDPMKGGNKYLKMARELVENGKMHILEQLRGLDVWRDAERIEAIQKAAEKYSYQLAQNLKKLVEMVRLTLSKPTDRELRAIIKRFEIDIEPYDEDVWPFVLESVPFMLHKGIELARSAGEIDFTDMIWLPSSQALNLQPKQYDVVLVDEAQDLSPCQRELALRACKPNGQKIFVGDRCQSIYAFAGASLRSIDEIIEATGAIELPLSICYRCPRVVIEEARSVGADYERIEAAPNAPQGQLEYCAPEKVSGLVQSGDLILCRLTAPLVSKCLELLRDGKRANVRGRDLGAQFTSMIEQVQKFSSNLSEYELFSKLVEVVRAYERRQIEILSLNIDENEMKIATLEDKVDTLLAFHEAYVGRANGSSSLSGFEEYIKSFFREDPGAQIILSTGHRAKGLEYPRVFILDYDKLPHPRAKTPEALKQEWNLQYVMVTRAQQALFLVGNYREPEPMLFDDLVDDPVEALTDTHEEAVQLLVPAEALVDTLTERERDTKPVYPFADMTVNTKGDIRLDSRVVVTLKAIEKHHPEIIRHGVVRRIDRNSFASGDDGYLVELDGSAGQYYFSGDQVQPEPEQAPYWKATIVPPTEEEVEAALLDMPPESAPRRRGRTPAEPTKKKDFRLPVNLLEALKAVADEEGLNDTALIIELLKRDERIQQKLNKEMSTCQ